VVKKQTTVEAVNDAMRKAAAGALKGVLFVSDEPLVSCDYIGNAASSTLDSELTSVMQGNMVKVVSWYDNEWGYSNRTVDLTAYIAQKTH
jgi:glyceraldehyde 3-phosphate dehydrogenase